MELDTIRQKLTERFAAPLPDFYQRRIIFWHDEEHSFEEMVDSLEIPRVKLLKLTGKNTFYAKQLLSHEDLDSDYLVYDPLSYSDIRDNWLLDIQCYSESFRADLLSMRMEEYGVRQSTQLRSVMRQYQTFFANHSRGEKLKALSQDYASAGQLRIGILTVLSGASRNTPAAIIKAVLDKGVEEPTNSVLDNLTKFAGAEDFWKLCRNYTGYVYQEDAPIVRLAAHILLTALAATMEDGFFRGLEDYLAEGYQTNCYDMVQQWLHEGADDSLYRVCREVEELCGLRERFAKLELAKIENSELFPCIDECILAEFLEEIGSHRVRIQDILSVTEKRRTTRWFHGVKNYYDGIVQTAHMQKFYQDHAEGFSAGQYIQLWDRYQQDYCQMDQFYRRFHCAFGASLRQPNLYLEDRFKGAAEYVEGLYKNWYLKNLSAQWTNLTQEELQTQIPLAGLRQQRRFYADMVTPLLSSGSRVFVIISDALRYEVAAELAAVLIRDTKGTATLSAMQSVLPSVTKYGMAALLPHRNMSVDKNGEVLCDGMSTKGTENRQKILQAKNADSIAVNYQKLLSMRQSEKRELLSGKTVVYIYHNAIDSVGEARATEDRVFAACQDAIGELKNLVRVITNELNGTNILITADHGFLYSRQMLDTYEKTAYDPAFGEIAESDRRYMIADTKERDPRFLNIPMDGYGSTYRLMIPKEAIRFKAGGGENYVHGGSTLQEMMVPVIAFKNLRSSSKQYVQASKAALELISSGRKISNNIFSLNFHQKEPVGGKVSGCSYCLFFADAAGNPISDIRTVIADKTEQDAEKRVFRVRFALKGQSYPKTEAYFLMIQEKDSGHTVGKIPFAIDIAFANDFDF